MNRTALKPLLVLLGLLAATRSPAGEITAQWDAPTLDRWMYPFNATPGTRPRAPVFGTLGDDAGVDSLHGQFILAFDTTNQVPAGRPLTAYLVRRAVFEATVAVGDAFLLDPTPDLFGSFFPTNDLRFVADDDPGRPVELFGTGFRGGFTAATFPEDGPFGGGGPGERNAFAAGFNAAAELVDVGNHVGKTNAALAPFPAEPFAAGNVTNHAAGEPVPAGARMRFELNLADPRVRGYVLRGLRDGRLWFTLASLHGGTLGGQVQYPDFATRENLLYDAPSLQLELTLVEPEDTDGDGLPDDWERHYFGDLTPAAADDPDQDGAAHAAELAAGSDPADAASSPRLILRGGTNGWELAWSWLPAFQPRPETSADTRSWTPVVPRWMVTPDGLAKLPLTTTDEHALFRLRWE